MKTLIVITAIAFFQPAVAAAATLVLNPASGIVEGSPGQAAGWGYVLTNNSPFFDVLTFSFLLVQDGSGTYQDYLSLPQSFEVIPPGSINKLGQVFDASTGSGSGEFDIFPSATPAFLDATLFLFYDEYGADPEIQSFPHSVGNLLQEDVTIQILPSAATEAPEPIFFIPSALLLLGMTWIVNRRVCTRSAPDLGCDIRTEAFRHVVLHDR